MRRTSARFISLASVVVVASLLLAGASASASVTEPDGTVVPTDASVGKETQVQTLLTMRGEMLDEKTDALQVPAVFSPTCGFTGTLVLSQAGCHSALGWYNVDPTRTTAPAPAEVFELVPNSAPLNTQFSGGDIQNDVRYKGGLIGFAIWDTSNCTQYHFSESQWNPVYATNNQHWVESLSYQSTVTPNAYYLAFEDGTSTSTSFSNDGDFNDKVFFITGITCQGGGTACDTGKKGVCAAGVEQCHGGSLTCVQVTVSGTETCDGLDNDCNGLVDDGSNLCGPNKVCDRGACVDRCVEQACPIGQACSGNGICSEPACDTVTCGTGTRCVGGSCVDPCDSVMCPHAQVCRAGRCVDPCSGVTCDANFVCVDGVCTPSCTCQRCASGLTCQPDDRCVETACAGVTCTAGTYCSGGTCHDSCLNVTCPAGQICQTGSCVDPCAGVTCMATEKCSAGTCVPLCTGVTCSTGQTCQSGACVDACSVVTCNVGFVCRQGNCIDACAGVTCPTGQTCLSGDCVDACQGVTCGGGLRCNAGTCVDVCTGVTCGTALKCAWAAAASTPAPGVTCAAGKDVRRAAAASTPAST